MHQHLEQRVLLKRLVRIVHRFKHKPENHQTLSRDTQRSLQQQPNTRRNPTLSPKNGTRPLRLEDTDTAQHDAMSQLQDGGG